MDPLGSIKEVFIVIVLILMNGLLAMLEMALVSARKSRLEQLADEGSSKAAYILKLAKEPTEFLSTVQIGITLVGIGTGVYSGAMLAAPLEGLLREISVLRPYAGVVSYTFVVALVTYLSLILGELIPKKMALNNPEKVAMSFAGFIKVIITAFKPLTVFLSVSTRFLLNVGEQKMIENVFELDDLRVSEIMTPRTKITWLDVNDPLYKHLEVIAEKQYSCYVVAEEDLEHVLGVVYTKRFLADVLGATGASMRSSVQQPLYVPEGMYTQKLLDMFKDTRIKVALVMDEFGGLAGMVTLRDIIEHLVGDLPSYDEEFKQEIVEREDGSWLVDGLLPISEFKDFLDLDELPLEEKTGFNTVAGFVVTNIGHIPTAGNYFLWNGYRFEVVDMDGTRIDKILVEKLPETEAAETDAKSE